MFEKGLEKRKCQPVISIPGDEELGKPGVIASSEATIIVHSGGKLDVKNEAAAIIMDAQATRRPVETTIKNIERHGGEVSQAVKETLSYYTHQKEALDRHTKN